MAFPAPWGRQAHIDAPRFRPQRARGSSEVETLHVVEALLLFELRNEVSMFIVYCLRNGFGFVRSWGYL